MEQIGLIFIGIFGLSAILAGGRQINGKSYGLRQMLTDLALTCFLLIVGFFLAKLFFGG